MDSHSQNFSENDIVAIICSILEVNGTIQLTDLGVLLIKAAGSSIGVHIKREYKGLKNLLDKHKDLFVVFGKPPLIQVELQPKSISIVSNKVANKPHPTAPKTNIPNLEVFLKSVTQHLKKYQYKQLANLLKVRNSENSLRFNTLCSQLLDKSHSSLSKSSQQIINQSLGEYGETWGMAIGKFLMVCYSFHNADYQSTYSNQVAYLDIIAPLGVQEVWRSALVDARYLAIWADTSLEAAGQDSVFLHQLVNFLRGKFKAFEKEPGLLALFNTVVRIYCYTNATSNLHHLGKLGIRDNVDYPISDVVTWNFFIGRYYLYQGKYKQAHEMLSYSFRKCNSKFLKNKQTILTYLLPLNAIMGNYPQKELLQKYGLMQFYEILEAVKRGQFKKYDDALQLFQFAEERGVYLPLKRLSSILFRNLFKKTARVLGSMQPIPVTFPDTIKLTQLQTALQTSGYPADIDETECIIVNLIATKKIKAYIAHEFGVIKLAQGDPFPLLREIVK